MQAATGQNVALKEWALVCEALALGKQAILLRKGGIHEQNDEFQPDYPEFWLMPTKFHQGAESLNERGKALLNSSAYQRQYMANESDQIPLQRYAKTVKTYKLDRVSQLPLVEPLQVLSAETIEDRFQYREPGLWVLLLRVYENELPTCIPNSEHLAGCRSWVELPNLVTTSLENPVLAEEEISSLEQTLNEQLGSACM